MRSALVLAIVVSSSSAARADGFYFSEAVGGTRVHDDLAPYVHGQATRADIGFGVRRGHWAVQLDIASDMQQNNTSTTDASEPPDLTSVGISVKYLQPVSRHLEIYLRGRSMRGWGDNQLENYAGNGLGLGAGIQLKGKLRWASGALFIDGGYEYFRLNQQQPMTIPFSYREPPGSIDAQLASLIFGFALGTDF